MIAIAHAVAIMSEPLSSQDHVVARLTDFIEGDLNTRDRTIVETHLAHCMECRRVLDELKRTIELLGRLPRKMGPAD
jgi:anti-sigma factor RsiW